MESCATSSCPDGIFYTYDHFEEVRTYLLMSHSYCWLILEVLIAVPFPFFFVNSDQLER